MTLKVRLHPIRRRSVASLAVLAAAGGILASGCGNVQLAGVSTPVTTTSAVVQAQQTEPQIVTPTPVPAQTYNPPLQEGQLTAVVSSFDKPGFLGFAGTATAHVTVSNSTQVPLSGTLTVQFTDSGTAMGSPQTQQVSTLDPGQNQEYDFTYDATFHFIDGASVSVSTLSSSDTSSTTGVPNLGSTGVPNLGSTGTYSSVSGYTSSSGTSVASQAAPGY